MHFVLERILMNTIYIASKNSHKIEEMSQVLEPLGFTVLSMKDIPEEIEIIEDKDTFEGNALKKAKTVKKYVEGLVLADDSGLEVDALDGRPGVYSARFAGEHATNEENNHLLLERLEGVKERSARFVCAMALVGLKEDILVRGTLEGRIAEIPQLGYGFGYDPLFIVQEDGRYLSEYTMEEKNQISHRGKALNKLRKHFK